MLQYNYVCVLVLNHDISLVSIVNIWTEKVPFSIENCTLMKAERQNSCEMKIYV